MDEPAAANRLLKINVDFEFDNFKFPKYELPSGISEEQYIRELVYKGAALKYLGKDFEKNAVDAEERNEKKLKKELENNGFEQVTERLEYELQIINNMGYNGYFIIVWDFIRFAKSVGVFVGPGRGSAAGSLVSYVLDTTQIGRASCRERV